MSSEIDGSSAPHPSVRREGLSGERGAVGTEMAIVVAIVVGIAIALGAVMVASAQSHQACIPASPGAAQGPGCP